LTHLSPDTLTAYADVLLWALKTSRAVPFKNGELVLLRFEVEAVPLAEAIAAVRVGILHSPCATGGQTPAPSFPPRAPIPLRRNAVVCS